MDLAERLAALKAQIPSIVFAETPAPAESIEVEEVVAAEAPTIEPDTSRVEVVPEPAVTIPSVPAPPHTSPMPEWALKAREPQKGNRAADQTTYFAAAKDEPGVWVQITQRSLDATESRPPLVLGTYYGIRFCEVSADEECTNVWMQSGKVYRLKPLPESNQKPYYVSNLQGSEDEVETSSQKKARKVKTSKVKEPKPDKMSVTLDDL